MLEVVFPHSAGLDVHKKFVVGCCLQLNAETGEVEITKRRFSTMSQELEQLAEWLAANGVSHVAMESTGVYWQPVYNILEGQFEIYLVNAQHVQQVPGRKTDMSDAEWLMVLMRHGLLKPSFIPDRPQRELREVVRYRQSLVEERTRASNRLQKVLEDANLKLASVVTDIRGVSARQMLAELVAGQTDPEQLAELSHGRLRQKRNELKQALRGRVRPHHQFMIAQILGHLDSLDEEIAALESEIEARLAQMEGYNQVIELLVTIPGVDRQTAIVIVAELGLDMSHFATDKHVTAWAGLAPGNNETGGKQRPAKRRKGNRYLGRALAQAAKAASRSKGTYFKAMYHRLAARRGKNKATVAVGRKMLQIIYHMIKQGQPYHDKGEDFFDRRDQERLTKRLVRRLQQLGYQVDLQPASATALPT